MVMLKEGFGRYRPALARISRGQHPRAQIRLAACRFLCGVHRPEDLVLASIFASNNAARSQKKNPSSASNGDGLVGGRRGRGLTLINISSRRSLRAKHVINKGASRPFNADTNDRGRLPFWEHFAPREILIPTCSFRRQRRSPHAGKIVHGQRRDESDATWRSTWSL